MLTVRCGPAQSGRTQRLLAGYRTALREQPPGATLWLAPTWRAVAEVRWRLFDGDFAGCFSPGVMTFAQFAELVLRAAGGPIRPIDRLMKRELVRQIMAEQASRGRLAHFQSIAATSGLVDLVCEFISELKRLEIWPDQFHEACARRGIGQKDVELSEIYDAYQQALREHGLFDAEGRFWSARDVLQKPDRAAASPIPHPSHLVVVDGFADFTRTQHEILEILSGIAATTIVTLPLESEPRRADLFAKPLKTLAELRRRHPSLTVEEAARPEQTGWPAMAHLERTLFANPRDPGAAVAPPSALCDIEILAAARPLGEIELIGATVKRLLIDGVASPGDVAVVFRAPQEADALVHEVFGRLGLPVAFESGQSLDRSPALRALAALLQLDLDDWPFERLLAVLGGNYFQPSWPEWRDGRAWPELERTIRTLQIPRGRERLVAQLGRTESAEYWADAAACVRHLAAAFDALPERASLSEWGKAWRKLAGDTGLLAAVDDVRDDAAGHSPTVQRHLLFDRLAWNRLVEVLDAGDKLAAWLERRPPLLGRREALDALTDILRSERVGHAGDESGCVRVLAASSVRSLHIPFLFLAGLSEKVFPPPDRDDRLYSEAECVRLIEAGLPLSARAERTREEMLLFYEAVTRATKRLYLSYPALDDAAQPLLPSPFLRETEQAFEPAQLPRVERADLSPIPQDDEPLCLADFRIKALADALDGNVALLARLLRETTEEGRATEVGHAPPLPWLPSFVAGLEIINSRQDRDQFGPAEGMLTSTTAHYYLATRFPLYHTFSATELERYAACPFRFYLERVLEIEPIEDLTLEFDVLQRGRVVHDVLAAFHRRVNERFGRPASPLELEPTEFDAMLAAAVAESLPPEPDNPVQAALREIDRRLVVEWLSRYREQCQRYAELWKDLDRPMATQLLEVSFGRAEEPSPSTDLALEFSLDGQTVRVSGRIDRIDTAQFAGSVPFNVVDYKTGGTIAFSPETIRAGTTLQLPLYALAVMELLLPECDTIPWQAGYWYVRENGFRPRQALKMYRNDDGRIELEPQWEELRSELPDIVMTLVRGIRQGQFPVCNTDEHCTGRCPFRTICRINQVRSLEKTCQPTTCR